MNIDDRMSSEQGVAEAFLPLRVTRGSERTLITIHGGENHGAAGFQRHAGRVGELLQGDDVRVQFAHD